MGKSIQFDYLLMVAFAVLFNTDSWNFTADRKRQVANDGNPPTPGYLHNTEHRVLQSNRMYAFLPFRHCRVHINTAEKQITITYQNVVSDIKQAGKEAK